MIAILGAVLLGTPLELEWSAPAGCPSKDEVLLQVEALVGGALEGPSRLRARARLDASELDWRAVLDLETRSGRSSRRLSAPACSPLVEAVAVILALALERAPTPRVPVLPSETPPRVSAPPAARWGFGLAAEGSAGQFSNVGLGTGLRFHWALPELRLGLGLLAWLPQTVGGDDVEVQLGLVAGEIRAGVPVAIGPVELGPELAVELGRFEARGGGSNLERTSTSGAFHIAGGAGFVFAAPVLNSLWLRVRAEVFVAGSRPEVLIRDRQTGDLVRLFRSEPIAGRLALGLEVRVQ